MFSNYSFPAMSASTALLLLIAHPLAASAQSRDTQIVEELVVAASRLPTDIAKLSSSVTVITHEEITRQNSASVVDLLRGIEGVQITQPGGRGGIASLYLRGGEANFTSVFIDGVKVNNPNNTRGGSFDFTTLGLANIERVEIVRGPQSAIYGSDALAGVVNFVSLRPSENETKIQLETGEKGYSRQLLRTSRKLSANQLLSVGISQSEDSNSLSGGDFEATSLWASMQGQSNDQSLHYQFNINAADSERSSFPEDSGGPLMAELRALDQGESDDLQASLRVSKNWNAAWDSQVILTHYERDEFTDSPGVAPGIRDAVPPNSFDSDLTRQYLQVSNRYSWDEHSLSFGADYQSEEAESSGQVQFAPGFNFPSHYTIDRDIAGLFVDARLGVNSNLDLLTSLRYDAPASADSRFSPSLGLISRLPNGNSVIKANWSKGFKLPSFFALASPLVGNPELREEEVTSIDVEFSHRLSSNTQLRFSLFDSNYINLVDFDSEAFINVNRSEVTIRGGEAAIDLALSSQWSLAAYLSYQDIDVENGGKLRQRPDWQSGLQIAYQTSDTVQFHARINRLGDIFDSSIPTGDLELSAYTRADIAASWQVSEQLRLDAAIDNLLDKTYFEAIGFPAMGRRARLALDWRF